MDQMDASGQDQKSDLAARWISLCRYGGDTEGFLEGLDAEAENRFVWELCDKAIEDETFDLDLLMSTGIGLSFNGQLVAAAATLDWLDSATSQGRWAVAGELLMGLWRYPGTGQCTRERVDRLLLIYDRMEADDDEWGGGAFQLANVLRNVREYGLPPDPDGDDRIATAYERSLPRLPPEIRALFTGP